MRIYGKRWKDPSPSQKKKNTNGGKPEREHEKIKYSNPLGARSI
jgi:hypothetical protein